MSENIVEPSSNSFEIEPASWRDLSSLRSLEKVCFPRDSWLLLDLVGVLTFPNVVRMKAVIGGCMVGFIAGDLHRSKKMGWIATIGVLPEYRRRGIGGALLQACEKQLQMPQIRLNVRISNQYAINLYKRFGYHQATIWPNYYQDGEDALVLERNLP